MGVREVSLPRDTDEVEGLVRILAASVAVRILTLLIEERRRGGEGWLFLSEIADRLEEKPGTIGQAIQKLLPLLEERRIKGRRFFRSRLSGLTIVLEPGAGSDPPRIL